MKEVKSLYIHFPFCRHLCNYCDFYKHKLISNQQIDEFEHILSKQIDSNEELLGKKGFELKDLKSIYIGGGTPSLWSSRGAKFIKEKVIERFGLSSDCEFTVEVDPGMWTTEDIKDWRSIGVNRFSVGVQSFDDDYLKILDRAHDKSEVYELISYLKEKDANFSIDLMLGIPTVKDMDRNVIREIDELVKYNPSHFSIYILKCRSNYAHLSKLPQDDSVADEYLKVCEHMKHLGFEQYEVSNFAKKAKESFHNKEYWKYKSVAAIGATATGLLVESDELAFRYKWKASSEGYVAEELKGTSLLIEKLYMQLRAKNCFDINILDGDNKNKFENLVLKWKDNGYVAKRMGSIELSAQGYLMLDSLMDDIFKTLTI